MAAAASCHEGIDTTRRSIGAATLGDDIFGVLCDRVGASTLTEDVTGASYHDVCHAAENGEYATRVNEALLPAVAGSVAEQARARSIAKVEVMARRRGDLVRAFNAIFPDVGVDDPTTSAAGDTIPMHDALMSLAQTITPLYEQNPFDSHGAPLLPAATQALGRLFDALATRKGARRALERVTARQGYRPFPVALGAIRAALAYPQLRELAVASLALLGPEGDGAPELQQLLAVAKRELLTSKPVVAPLPDLIVDAATATPSRPRTNIEVTRALMLDEHPSYARDDGDPPRFIVLRDRRGFAIPFGSTPGVPGAVPASFVDGDGDGYADVDGFGRFLDGDGAPVALDTPFRVPGVAPIGPLDELGRPVDANDNPVWQYVDTSRTLAGSLARHLVTLLDATQTSQSDPDAPDAWKDEHETLMYLMGGAYRLYGEREDAIYDHANERVLRPDEPCEGDAVLGAAACTRYSRFRGEDSPLPRLVHAVGQVLADPDSDAVLLGLIDLLENHTQVVARLVGAALEVKAIADAHDGAARQGKEPMATMAYEVPLWDEIGAVVGQMTSHPGLVTELLAAVGDEAFVTPYGGSEHLGQTLSAYVRNKDLIQYNTDDLNGPVVNLTTGSGDDPRTPVDWTAPQSGANRSLFQRSLQAIADAAGVRTCNKNGAQIYTNFLSFDFHFGNYAECELFQIDNLAGTFLGSLLPLNHPKRSKMNIKPSELNKLLNIVGSGNADALFEDSSQIAGMTLHPTAQAFARLVLFGASSDEYAMPDLDANINGSNAQTNDFISSLMEPIAPVVCEKKGNGARHCETVDDLLRVRDAATLFAWERLGFYDYLRPTLRAFAEVSCTDSGTCDPNDFTGENLFLGLVSALARHWPGPEHGPECVKTVAPNNNLRYCSEAGGNRYEPILADAFMTDLIPAIREFAHAATELSTIQVARGPDAGKTMTGAEVLERLTKILFDPAYAAARGLVDRNGSASTTWTDGTPQSQLTVFSLFGDALHDMDASFDHACGCEGTVDEELAQCRDDCAVRGQWKRSRSQLVDELLAVEGTGAAAHFKSRDTAPMMLVMLRVLREQLNANCPNREHGEVCAWAGRDLGDKVAATLSGPVFAAIMDAHEKIRLAPDARRQLERFLGYVLETDSDDDSLQGMLASLSDLLQVLADDDVMSAIFNAVATVANPAADEEGPGAVDATLAAFRALTSDTYDRYRVLDVILPLVVTPMDRGEGPTPIEVFLDTIAEVNRIDADTTVPLTTEDYAAVMGSVRDFLTDDNRGLEQLYYIVQRRPRE